MFSKDFFVKLSKESVLIFLVTFGTVLLGAPGLSGAAATAGVVAGARAVIGVLVKNLGEDKDSPHL